MNTTIEVNSLLRDESLDSMDLEVLCGVLLFKMIYLCEFGGFHLLCGTLG